MSLTITSALEGSERATRNLSVFDGSIAFDSSYPTGGESASDISANFSTLTSIVFDNEDGYSFEYDKTNNKIKAYLHQTRPILVQEEAVTVASNVGTLAYPPLYIIAVQVTATTTTGAYNVIPAGETPLTKQVAVNFTTGGLTFKSTDVVTAVKITYIPQQLSGPLSDSSLVVDEAVTASASKVELANRAIAVQYVWDDIDGVLDALEPVGEAPSATHTAVIDITNATPTTDIDSHADDAGNTLKVTYLKYAGIGAPFAINDTDTSLTSEAYDFTATGKYHAMVVPGLGTQVVGEQGDAGNGSATWEHAISGTAAAGVATWDPRINYLLTNESTALVTLAMPFFILDEALMYSPGTGMEVPNGTDLSGIGAVRFLAIGLCSK